MCAASPPLKETGRGRTECNCVSAELVIEKRLLLLAGARVIFLKVREDVRAIFCQL